MRNCPQSSGPLQVSTYFMPSSTGSRLLAMTGMPALLSLRNMGTTALASTGNRTTKSGFSVRH